MEHTLALIGRAHQGDKEARDTLFEENTGLIYSVARRFLGRGVEMEDLFQIGSIGLLKAVDKFDPAFEVKFSTYAIPMILGELKRFFRDDGMIKVSRSIKKPAQSLSGERKDRERTGQGTEPQRNRRNARNAARRSRDDDGLSGRSRIPVQNRLSERGNRHLPHRQDPGKENAEEHLLNRIFLEEILGKLESSDRKLLYMRYFQDQTQTQIAEQLGVSQVQVSRMEKRILKKLRSLYRDG